MSGEIITQTILDSINNENASTENKGRLEELGGVNEIALGLGVDLNCGVDTTNVSAFRDKFGDNTFPESPMDSFWEILLEALSDSTLLILVAAASCSLVIGVITEPEEGWIEGAAIFIAVGAVSSISAANDYSKQLQFRALEDASAKDERCGVLRDDRKDVIPVSELVVGDILILQAGDQISADCVIFDTSICKANESSLTGETDDLKKEINGDPFLLSSCNIIDVEGQDCRAMVIAVGRNSQWGKIKGNLVTDAVNTPLQDKLEVMTTQIGYVGMIAAFGTFVALVIRIFVGETAHHGSEKEIVDGFVHAFIISVTIVVVAIPEGLPLAVTISLAYSTKKMYTDNCFIRVLAACETMGNATNICSDKTGTLTENKMAVVEGWFADKYFNRNDFSITENDHDSRTNSISKDISRQNSVESELKKSGGFNITSTLKSIISLVTVTSQDDAKRNGKEEKVYKIVYRAPPIPDDLKRLMVEHMSVNRTAYLILEDQEGMKLDTPSVVGSKTEGALILLVRAWGFDCEHVKQYVYDGGSGVKDDGDKLFSFNSTKKRSTCVVRRPDGSVRMYVKGASEQILKDCSYYTKADGTVSPMILKKFEELNEIITTMAEKALRTLVLAHKDFSSISDMPRNWRDDPPDDSGLCVDCMVGIMDPLRSDVKEAVRTAQEAGVIVRMVTGDNVQTAIAIATDCGILTNTGMAIEGPTFRRMTPADVDAILPNLQVMARSSPDDKHLLVTRLNGHAIPANQADWEKKFQDRMRYSDITWDNARDKLLPGYKEEWSRSRPEGGQVVGVTGDGTNDAPALKAADVGLAMGITGTKVAQGAADIVVLDDRFSSIVRAMMWGRSVYDNIRKFLQFQLTVNVVALLLVFLGAVLGYEPPLNAVQMLWVNLVMDTLGALALGTEQPIPALLERKPYKRQASLISIPMTRNIAIQSLFQLAVLFYIMTSPEAFGIEGGVGCLRYKLGVPLTDTNYWDLNGGSPVKTLSYANADITCSSFRGICHSEIGNTGSKSCYTEVHYLDDTTSGVVQTASVPFSFDELPSYEDTCLVCAKKDYTHGSIIFNAFIWCQIFNEYSSRVLFNELNMFRKIFENNMFFIVSIFTIGLQVILIEFGDDFMKTTPLNFDQWITTIIIGAITIPVGFLMRYFLPVEEDPAAYFDNSTEAGDVAHNEVYNKFNKNTATVHKHKEVDELDESALSKISLKAGETKSVPNSPVKVAPSQNSNLIDSV